jgi:four helix bundle protein
MKIEKFEDIKSWQKGQEIARIIHKYFWSCKDYSFKDQIERVCISISNNIAEWFERKTNNELFYFLFIAKWSCAEVRSMLYLAQDYWYISSEDFENLYNLSIEISKLLSAFITSIKKSSVSTLQTLQTLQTL